jgi:16S rRNA (cytosine967-C5)-methyltransferase
MPVSSARDAALDILLRVEQGGFASELLHSERLEPLTPQDRALATELVMGVLRWRSRLDEAIASVSSQKLSKLDAEVLESLRLAAYQIGFLARIPAHAAVNDAVELVKRKKKKSAAPFVNAVLRKLLSKKDVLEPVLVPGEKTVPDLAALYAHPEWLVGRWAVLYGIERTEAICAYNQRVPPTAIHLGDAAAEAELVAAGIELSPGRLLRSARIVTKGDITKSAHFAAGRVHIQDEGSQLIALLAGRGERLLDCCAAPGGKTAILAERNPTAEILATELHEHRAQALRKRLARRPNVEVTTADASQLTFPGEFDRILADVPCSGTGTLARNPEIKWRLTGEDLNDLHARQVAILRGALSKLRPGGRLLYSTCSLEPEENENVLGQILSDPMYQLLPVSHELAALREEGELTTPDIEVLTDGPCLRLKNNQPFLHILPGAFGTDGFFAALLTRP